MERKYTRILNRALQQFIQAHFQTRFRFRNAFESRLTLAILHLLIEEHPESLLLTRSEIERLAGTSLEAPALLREYFPQRSVTLLATALDELTSLSIQDPGSAGQIRYPLFRRIQLDQVAERLRFDLNVEALPVLTRWSGELRQFQANLK